MGNTVSLKQTVEFLSNHGLTFAGGAFQAVTVQDRDSRMRIVDLSRPLKMGGHFTDTGSAHPENHREKRLRQRVH